MCGTMGGKRHRTKDVKSGGPMTVGEPAGHAANVKMTPKWHKIALALVVKIAEALANAHLGPHASTRPVMNSISVISTVV